MSATIVRDRRQTTVPADIADRLQIEPGDQIDWQMSGDGAIVRKLVPVSHPRRLTGKLVRRGGACVFEFPGTVIDPETFGKAISQAIQEERSSQ